MSTWPRLLTWPAAALLACSAHAAGPSLAQRAVAAEATARSQDNACKPIRPFYWEVGDAAGAQASGSVDEPGNDEHITAETVMNIASASKWLYGAYVVQRRGGAPTEEDIRHLNFQAGYSDFSWCLRRQTVGECPRRADGAGRARQRRPGA
ncbi:MAG: hypothetical protein ACOZJX_15345 [Pseudomonadota bacterium]